MNIDLGNTQAQIEWLKQKLFLDTVSNKAAIRKIKRGQVYHCELGMNVGSELQKKRPCVIIQNDIGNTHSPITTIVPITHTQKNLNCFVHIADKYDKTGNLILDGFVNVAAIRSIDKARIGDYICDVETNELTEIEKAIACNIDIMKHYVTMQNLYKDKLDHVNKLNAILDEVKTLLKVNDNKAILSELKKVLDKEEKI